MVMPGSRNRIVGDFELMSGRVSTCTEERQKAPLPGVKHPGTQVHKHTSTQALGHPGTQVQALLLALDILFDWWSPEPPTPRGMVCPPPPVPGSWHTGSQAHRHTGYAAGSPRCLHTEYVPVCMEKFATVQYCCDEVTTSLHFRRKENSVFLRDGECSSTDANGALMAVHSIVNTECVCHAPGLTPRNVKAHKCAMGAQAQGQGKKQQ